MTPESITALTSASIYGVAIILAAAGAASALGWAIISYKYLEGIARQPELESQLRVQLFVVGGMIESFPFIIFAVAMWITNANPFIAYALTVIKGASSH